MKIGKPATVPPEAQAAKKAKAKARSSSESPQPPKTSTADRVTITRRARRLNRASAVSRRSELSISPRGRPTYSRSARPARRRAPALQKSAPVATFSSAKVRTPKKRNTMFSQSTGRFVARTAEEQQKAHAASQVRKEKATRRARLSNRENPNEAVAKNADSVGQNHKNKTAAMREELRQAKAQRPETAVQRDTRERVARDIAQARQAVAQGTGDQALKAQRSKVAQVEKVTVEGVKKK